MSKARKSSIDGTRRILKAHIPFRADDFTHGKKTGINVREVTRRSDGFEEFGDVLHQADDFTPPHLRGRRYADRSPTPEEEEVDEDGEMSMDIDTSAYSFESTYDYPLITVSHDKLCCGEPECLLQQCTSTKCPVQCEPLRCCWVQVKSFFVH